MAEPDLVKPPLTPFLAHLNTPHHTNNSNKYNFAGFGDYSPFFFAAGIGGSPEDVGESGGSDGGEGDGDEGGVGDGDEGGVGDGGVGDGGVGDGGGGDDGDG